MWIPIRERQPGTMPVWGQQPVTLPVCRGEYLSNYEKLEQETERRNKEIQLERKVAHIPAQQNKFWSKNNTCVLFWHNEKTYIADTYACVRQIVIPEKCSENYMKDTYFLSNVAANAKLTLGENIKDYFSKYFLLNSLVIFLLNLKIII
jgi:hypothetical protein